MAKATVKASHISIANRYLLILCLVGDFGLATSSLAAVDPSDVSPHIVTPEADMTLGAVRLNTSALYEILTCDHRGGDQALYCSRGSVQKERAARPQQGGFV
jgi:hypothetical protein